jgi:hypothetical protein
VILQQLYFERWNISHIPYKAINHRRFTMSNSARRRTLLNASMNSTLIDVIHGMPQTNVSFFFSFADYNYDVSVRVTRHPSAC